MVQIYNLWIVIHYPSDTFRNIQTTFTILVNNKTINLFKVTQLAV